MAGPESYPYYIMTPDYKTSSLGIQVMHYLCHLLNEKGYQAWIVNAKTNPAWNTPVLSEHLFRQHKQQKIPFIAVYPEIVSGNPLNAPVVVRYMLNHEGKMNGNSIDSEESDLIFWYRKEFADKAINPSLLKLECIDLDLFCDEGKKRDLNFLYLNRVPESAIDFSRLPDELEILSMRNPLTLEKLAEKFKSARVLYSFESSGTNTLASLCGCPVVALKAKGYENYAVTEATIRDAGATAYCWDDSEASLADAREKSTELRQQLLAAREVSLQQLEDFIHKTQSEAKNRTDEIINSSLQHWISHRQLPPGYCMKVQSGSAPRLLILIHEDASDDQKTSETISSIHAQSIVVDIEVITRSVTKKTSLNTNYVLANDFASHIQRVTERGSYDWMLNVSSGIILAHESLPVIINQLANTDYSAVGCDEVWLNGNDESWTMKRDALEEEILYSAPHVYMKRWLFSFAALRQLNGAVIRFDRAYETDLLLRIHNKFGPQSLGYHSDALCVLANYAIDELEIQESAEALKQNLATRGCTDVGISCSPDEPLRIAYARDDAPLVSVIVLAGEDAVLLENSLMSFLENTNWDKYEILIINHDNNCDSVNQWLEAVAKIDVEKIRVVREENIQGRKSLLELAIKYARGEYYLFIDTAITFLIKNWLTILINSMQRENIGCVAPKLIGRDKKIISAGLGLNQHGRLENIGLGLPWDARAINYLLSTATSVTAVAKACWLVSRACWEAVKGFEEIPQNIAAVDTGFMIQARILGYKTLLVPESVVIWDGECADCSAADEQALQAMIYDNAVKFRATNQLISLLQGFQKHTIKDNNTAKRWIARRQCGIPLIALIGNGNGDGDRHLSRFKEFILLLEKEQELDVISFEKVPHVAELMSEEISFAVVMPDVEVPESNVIQQLKTNLPYKFYGVADETLSGENIKNWLDSDLLTGWLTYSLEQQRWLTKKNKKSIATPAYYPYMPAPCACNESSVKLRVLCDTRYLTNEEINFLTPIIIQTAVNLDWVIYGHYPRVWVESVSETWRVSKLNGKSPDLTSLKIDVAVIPALPHKNTRYKDNYELLEYRFHNISVVTSQGISFDADPDVVRVKNKTHEWVKGLLMLAQRKSKSTQRTLLTRDESSCKTNDYMEKVLQFLATLSDKDNNKKQNCTQFKCINAAYVERVS
ncbi:glycosyltransferase family 2 protein [Pantoea sp. Acro-805]|uniref:Glycosyltransferase family 2 protein n=1 Tax=Candidatus Pantoea formicae TaxID=2608355 RepID=A0ABX0QUU3_9GAMM|nr:glycosyltransferase family 2 protein [Pantoea formicae]MDF7651455.1 glycosyltransferase family 2 protein [Erwiniaceae bacterium L1_54_3]NIF00799.1 glycosyltransferase family 2 protein [Pantoea formicae]